MSLINYIFIGLCRLLQKTGDNDIAEYSAIFFVSLGITLNLFVFLRILGFDPKPFLSTRLFGFVVFVFVLILNCVYFIYKGRYKALLENSQRWSTDEKRTNAVLSIFFCIESVLIPILYSLIEDGLK